MEGEVKEQPVTFIPDFRDTDLGLGEAAEALNKVSKGFHVGDPPFIPEVDMIPIIKNLVGTIQTMFSTLGNISLSLGGERVTFGLRIPIFVPENLYPQIGFWLNHSPKVGYTQVT